MKRAFRDFLSLQDHFGVTPNHLHKSKRQFHFLFSEIISLLINIGCITLFTMQLFDLINRTKPNINFVSLQQSNGPNITLSEDLIIAFGVLDQQYNKLIDPKLFDIHANYEVTTIHNGIFSNVITKLEQTECNLTNLPEYRRHGYEHEFFSNSLDRYYCFKQTVNKDKITLGGNFGSSFYGVMSFRVSRCNNQTNNNNCYSNEIINDKIKLAWFEVFFLDHFIDINNFEQPIQTYSNSFYTTIEPKFTKSYWASFNGINMFSDHGILFETNNTFSAVKFEKDKFDVAENEGGLGDFIEFGLISSANNEVYYRSYLKIQDICAVIGGLLNGLNIVFGFVFGFIGQKLYNIELINNIFSFKIAYTNANTYNAHQPNIISAFIGNKNTCVNDNSQFDNAQQTPVVNVTKANTIKRKKLMKVQLNSIEPIKQNEIPMQKINVNAKKNRFQMTLGEIICSSITCGSKHGCCEKKRNYNSNNISNYERKKIFLLFKKKIEFSMTILLQNEITYIKKCILKDLISQKKFDESVSQKHHHKLRFLYYLDSANSAFNSSNYNQIKNDSSFGLMEITNAHSNEKNNIGTQNQRKSVISGGVLNIRTPSNTIMTISHK